MAYYTLYIIHYTLYIIHYTLYTLYIIHYTLYIIHYTLYIIHYTLYIIHYTLYIIHYTLYIVYYLALPTLRKTISMYNVQSTVGVYILFQIHTFCPPPTLYSYFFANEIYYNEGVRTACEKLKAFVLQYCK